MGKKILISGGSGLVGSILTQRLEAAGHTVSWLTRTINPSISRPQFEWDISKGTIDAESVESAEVIIHLAGTSINAKRWNENTLRDIRESRVQSAALLYSACVRKNQFPAHYISGSALGYYGFDAGDNWLSEDAPAGTDFLADIVVDWENSALPFGDKGCKVAWLRTGIVLSRKGGALKEMMRPVKMGVGSPLGDGQQFISWIHEKDQVEAIHHIIEKELDGTFNLTAPEPEKNADFMRKIARILGRPFFMPAVPGFVLKLVLGPMAKSVLGSVRCSSKKLEESGFQFKFGQSENALKDLLGT